MTSFKASLRRDYKATLKAYKKAQAENDSETMNRLASDLVRIADAMEGEE